MDKNAMYLLKLLGEDDSVADQTAARISELAEVFGLQTEAIPEMATTAAPDYLFS